MNSASIVIVGAGVMGASVAYHLAARGWRDVLVLDRSARLGQGSTGAATGGFRAQYATAINVRLSLIARKRFLRFQAEVGVDPGYVPAGYLWLAVTGAELDVLRAGLEIQRAEGLHEAREVDSEEVGTLNPAVRRDDVIGGVFCPSDGFIAPLRVLSGYLAAALRMGVRVEWKTNVTGLTRDAAGKIVGVETSRGHIGTGAVVNAAGAWAGCLASCAGVSLPVSPLRRQVASTVPCAKLPADMPMTIFAGDGFHFRVRDGRVLLLWPTPGVPGKPFDTRVDEDWVDAVTAMARQRVPLLREVGIDVPSCWAGLYEMSPDKHAILGAAPGCDNLYLINGSSGHGVMHAPALGALLAELISDGKFCSLDVTALRPSRFLEGAPNPGSALL
ncbi:MAG TPA: FAD-dependent oxidoreductase [Gemmatimonadales bacterium]|nr:FAD-dependent oxidoreductase [Gemmatimonadales bacterium]